MRVCQKQIRKLDQFYLRCLRSIARIKRRDKVPNTDVLRICDITGIEVILLQAQLPWVGHVVCMPDIRIPKQVFYGELEAGRRLPGGPVKRYKDSLNTNLKARGITPRDINTAPLQRNSWRSRCQTAVVSFKADRTNLLCNKRANRKAATTTTTSVWTCDICGRTCSRIGLYAHRKTH